MDTRLRWKSNIYEMRRYSRGYGKSVKVEEYFVFKIIKYDIMATYFYEVCCVLVYSK